MLHWAGAISTCQTCAYNAECCHSTQVSSIGVFYPDHNMNRGLSLLFATFVLSRYCKQICCSQACTALHAVAVLLGRDQAGRRDSIFRLNVCCACCVLANAPIVAVDDGGDRTADSSSETGQDSAEAKAQSSSQQDQSSSQQSKQKDKAKDKAKAGKSKGKDKDKSRRKSNSKHFEDLKIKLPPDLKAFDFSDFQDMDSLKAKLDELKLNQDGEMHDLAGMSEPCTIRPSSV